MNKLTLETIMLAAGLVTVSLVSTESSNSSNVAEPKKEMFSTDKNSINNLNLLEIKSKNTINYDSLITNIKVQQEVFQKKYFSASNSTKKEVLLEATDFVYDKLITEIFPSWYGTPWVFGGRATEPHPNKKNPSRKESIDCGYFVTKTLHDVGFNIDKIKLAQQASENIIKNISAPENIHRYRNKSVQFVFNNLDELSEGLYITGLDIHAGFILNEKNNKKFIHSSYYPDQLQVVSENIIGHNPFAHSKYRVLGKILDAEMMKKWLTGERFEIKYK